MLVPTTLLVQQHMSTFSERFAAFPVKVAALSRFQTDKEAKAVIAGLADGTVDVVIGTHRLFSAEVRFKDLGLVIVDEEQRFGVEHKEHLKELRTNVDVLAMSATPIPRTLEMAVTGIREMSTIPTPPEERHPVLTYVGPYDDKQVAAAIRRELLREGQVFYVHNRVESIDRVAAKLARARARGADRDRARPDGRARARAGHRRLLGEASSTCSSRTTIVETGLDIPNANTLIVDRADMFGLSQLHQLRGRVGPRPRARLRLLPLPAGEAAHRDRARPARDDRGQHRPRLRHGGRDEGPRDPRRRQPARRRAVRPHRRRRLRPLRAARRRGRRGVPPGRRGAAEELADVKVELPVDAHLPHDYVAEERLRLEAYKRLAAAVDRGRRRRRRRGAHRPLRPAPRAGREPAGRRAVPDPRPAGRGHRGRGAGELPAASRPSNCRTRARCGSRGSTRDPS